jgi:outer membrane protein OmpA-like peptidoglycan-associated protein
MKKSKITNISVLIIFLGLLLFIDNGLSDFRHTKKQESLQMSFQQDSLTKSKDQIIEYFKKAMFEGTHRGVSLDPLQLNIPFDFNSSELNNAAKKQLDELGEAIQSEVLLGIFIELAGHTDERGTSDYNRRLSKKRVERAKNYLIRNYYIQANQINEIGYGETKPIIKNAKTESEHSVNRRVETSRWEQNETRSNSKDLLTGNQNILDGLIIGLNDFACGVVQVKGNGTEEFINVAGNATLESNNKYRIFVKSPKPSYVYIYQEDSNRNGAWLFPRAEVIIKNPLGIDDNWIPSRYKHFTLDKNIGTETIYLVASDKPDKDLEDVLYQTNSTPTDTIISKIKTRGKFKTRGVESIGNDFNTNMIIAEIKDQNWDFYMEIKFKHK